ncbi:energy transducer TonB [Sphingomonas gei]|uniref:energy transducer TonB n=1 Tax=Sphingomonas gei TaxID=1395960 RepID=UPI0014411382|nr:energy transducer TonB [Sphingomonas gei]
MVRTTGWLYAVVALLPAGAAAKEPEPEVLARAAKWQVDYDKEACHLLAKFGEGRHQVIARFTRYKPGDAFDLTLYGSRLLGLNAKVPVTVAFGAGGSTVIGEAMTGTAGEETPLLVLTNLRLDGRPGDAADAPGVTPAQESAIAEATFVIPRKRAFRLGFGSLGQPLAALRACQADLLRHWGFDPQVQARLSRPAMPVAEPTGWINGFDYPQAMRVGNNVLVRFRLDLDSAGAVSACHVLYRSKPDDFADVACRAVSERARFRPALDAEGKPVRSFYIDEIRWLAPLTEAD